MKRNAASLSGAIVLGVAGAVLWCRQLAFGFEEGTGLPAVDFFPARALGVLSVVGIVFAAVMALSGPKAEPGDRLLARLSTDRQWKKLLWVAGAFLMLIAGGTAFYEMRLRMRLSGLVMGALLLLSGAGILGLASAGRKGGLFRGEHALFCLAPMYWGCYAFMLTFKSEAGNPVILRFLPQLLAVMFVMLGFYRFAACLFGRSGSRMLVFFSICAVYFALVVCVGQLLARLLYACPLPETLWQLPAIAGGALALAADLLLAADSSKGKREKA